MINEKIKSWNIESVTGGQVPTTTQFEGKPLLILFYYLGCPGCVGRAIPFANRMVFEYGDKLEVIGIHSNFEGPEYEDEEIVKEMNALFTRFPYYKDTGFASTFFEYKAGGTPHWILVNKNGKIAQSIFGSDPNRALLRLDYAINEELNH